MTAGAIVARVLLCAAVAAAIVATLSLAGVPSRVVAICGGVLVMMSGPLTWWIMAPRKR